MSGELSTLLSSQHRRQVATVMGYVEAEVYPLLSVEQRKELREVVIRAAGVYHDAALDCLKALSSDADIRNERLYDLLEQIHRCVIVPHQGRT